MPKALKDSARKFKIYMTDSADPLAGKTGLASFTVKLAKDSAAEATVSPTITERGGGWYEVTPLAAHRDTLGESAWTFTHAGANDFARLEEVVAIDVRDADSFGLSRIDENVSAPKTLTADYDAAKTASQFNPATDAVNVSKFLGTSITETSAGYIAAAFTKLLDVASPVKDINDIGTATGSGSSHTAEDVAELILATPTNKLATDASGYVVASNMRGTDGAATSADIASQTGNLDTLMQGYAVFINDNTVLVGDALNNAILATPAAVEAAMLNEGDATALLAAIAAKVEQFLINDGDATATLAAIASAVRTNLATELARIDENVSAAKVLTVAYDAAKTASQYNAAADTVNLGSVLGTALTEDGAGRLAASFVKFLNVATPTKTINDIGTGTGGGGGGSPTGAGSEVVDDIVITEDGSPVDGAAVWVTTEAVPGGPVAAGTLYTDAFGKPDPYFLLDPGTYYLWVQRAGTEFPNPTEFEVPAP